MALPIPMTENKNAEKGRKIYWDNSHEFLDCFISSYFSMPPGINSCITLDERLCEDCYNFIQHENIGKYFKSTQTQSSCTNNYLIYKEEKLKFESDKKFSGPYPRYKCHFHSQIQRTHYCPIYECFLKEDVAKWTMQETSKLNDATAAATTTTTDTRTQEDATEDTGKGAWLAHAVTIMKPSKIADHNNNSIANQLMRPLLSDDGSNMLTHPTASTKFDWGNTTYHHTNSTITTMQNVVSSSKISPTTSQENIIVSSSKISPAISQENLQVHLSFPNHDSSLFGTVATRAHVPQLTSTIPLKSPYQT